uniref:Uncharacterized protein n=1 Tax=Physcomitrium patens TaxID=3218 RepID=A0A7I4DX56_PHYPA
MATTGANHMQAKLVLLGDMGAGKSSLALRFVKGQFFDYQDSFGRAKKWVQELQRQGNPNLVMALAGNKADLSSKRKIEAEEGQSYAEENGLFFMETSAKTSQNVNELFYEIARKLPKAQPAQASGMSLTDGSTSRLGPAKSTCCA